MLLGRELYRNNKDIAKWKLIIQIVGNAFYIISCIWCIIIYFCFYHGFKCPKYPNDCKSPSSTNGVDKSSLLNNNAINHKKNNRDNNVTSSNIFRNDCVIYNISCLVGMT